MVLPPGSVPRIVVALLDGPQSTAAIGAFAFPHPREAEINDHAIVEHLCVMGLVEDTGTALVNYRWALTGDGYHVASALACVERWRR